METVTRFLLDKTWYNVSENTVCSAAYYTPSNIEHKEVSVFDIDEELSTGDENRIYKIGEKTIFKNRRNIKARADLKVIDIEKIKTNKGNLRVIKSLFSKHCNIRPFPSDASALNVAGHLARISELQIRKK